MKVMRDFVHGVCPEGFVRGVFVQRSYTLAAITGTFTPLPNSKLKTLLLQKSYLDSFSSSTFVVLISYV